MRTLFSALAVLLLFSVLILSVGFVRISFGEWASVDAVPLYRDGEASALLLKIPSEVRTTSDALLTALGELSDALPSFIEDGIGAVLSELCAVGGLLREALAENKEIGVEI